MAVQIRVRKLANPRRVRFTAKQIKAGFGGKRRQAAMKANRKRKRNTAHVIAKHRPRSKPRAVKAKNRRTPQVRYRTRTVTKIKYRTRKVKANPKPKRRRRLHNPAPVIVTLGATNPKRRTMAHKHRNAKQKSRNPSRQRKIVYVSAHKHSNRRKKSRNPITVFGSSGRGALEMIGGGLVGMAGTKFLPTLVPASVSGIGGATFSPVIWSGVSAFIMKYLAGMVKKGAFQDAVFFGGLIQTGSTALTAFFPSLATQFGLGYLQPANFVVPQNPITAMLTAGGSSGPIPGPTARVGVNGLSRAFGSAF